MVFEQHMTTEMSISKPKPELNRMEQFFDDSYFNRTQPVMIENLFIYDRFKKAPKDKGN